VHLPGLEGHISLLNIHGETALYHGTTVVDTSEGHADRDDESAPLSGRLKALRM
jgi:hypothetical protein